MDDLSGPPADPDPTLQVAPIAMMALSAFVFVTAETLPVGLLPQIAHGLSVSEADVGLLLTSYAAVAALSTIPLTALTMRIRRDRLLAAAHRRCSPCPSWPVPSRRPSAS